jgi:antitoxin ParD1/3/4
MLAKRAHPDRTLVVRAEIAASTKFWYLAGMPSKNTSIALGDHFVEYARRKVESGEFGSTSEVVREAMRRYIAEDMKLDALKRELQKGLDSGPARPFDWDAFMERKFGPPDD